MFDFLDFEWIKLPKKGPSVISLACVRARRTAASWSQHLPWEGTSPLGERHVKKIRCKAKTIWEQKVGQSCEYKVVSLEGEPVS